MSTVRSVPLSDWIIIKISGAETMEYLNGIITLDLEGIQDDEYHRAAFLTPSAKIRSIFWVIKSDSTIYLYTSQTFKDNLVADLLKYKLSMDVKLEDVTKEMDPLYLVETEKEIPGLFGHNFGFEFIHTNDSSQFELMNYREFSTLLIESGVLPPDVGEGHNPYELGLSDMITLEKGCFLGQEPISRMYHRGNPRKYVYSFTSAGNGDIITKNGEEVGEVIISTDKVRLGYIKRQIVNFEDLYLNESVVKNTTKVGQYPKNDRV